MISIAEALKIIDESISALSTESVEIEKCVWRVLAEDVIADMDLPPFDRSQMDGFAVKSQDTLSLPARLKIIGESVAGKGFDGEVKSGEAVRIMTGARVPAGADAVQKVESTRISCDFVEILQTAEPLQNIVRQGEEIKKGTKIFSIGEQIKERMIPTLASFGYKNVKVYRQPKVFVLSTGTELVGIEEKPQKDQIRNSNSVMLAVFLKRLGIEAKVLSNIADDKDALMQTISQEILDNGETKVLITTGGDYDFTKPVFRELGAQIFFEKVALKPGKPTVFAKLGNSFIFGLPGNPVSSAVTFYLFVRRALLRLQGASTVDLESGTAFVKGRIKATKDRDAVLPVLVSVNGEGRAVVESLKFAGSSNFIEFAKSNALVYVPCGKTLQEGELAKIWFLDW